MIAVNYNTTPEVSRENKSVNDVCKALGLEDGCNIIRNELRRADSYANQLNPETSARQSIGMAFWAMLHGGLNETVAAQPSWDIVRPRNKVPYLRNKENGVKILLVSGEESPCGSGDVRSRYSKGLNFLKNVAYNQQQLHLFDETCYTDVSFEACCNDTVWALFYDRKMLSSGRSSLRAWLAVPVSNDSTGRIDASIHRVAVPLNKVEPQTIKEPVAETEEFSVQRKVGS